MLGYAQKFLIRDILLHLETHLENTLNKRQRQAASQIPTFPFRKLSCNCH